MIVAIDLNGNKIYPEKGLSGVCPICKSNVISACGEINVWHWRHENLEDCDSFSEGETEWHFNWKMQFSINWQEVVIKNEHGVIHRADIKTPNNLVLELQNSPISPEEIMSRESFYKNIIWLINAKDFCKNISLRSTVNRLLKNHDEYNPKNYFFDSENYLGDERKEILDLLKEIEIKEEDIAELKKRIDKIYTLISTLPEVDLEDDYNNFRYSNIFNDFDFNEIKNIKNQRKIIFALKKDIDDLQSRIQNIESLPNCERESLKEYKYVDSLLIPINMYNKSIFIENISSIFPDILIPKSEHEFDLLKKNKKYRLIHNFNSRVIELKEEIDKKNLNISKNLEDLENAIIILKNKIKIFLLDIFEKCNNTLQLLEINLDEIIKDMNKKVEEFNDLENESEKYFSVKNGLDIKKHENERHEIMKRFKGEYSYIWKNKRKCWDFSTKRKFLDFDNGFIYEIINDSKIKKISKSEFIHLIKIL